MIASDVTATDSPAAQDSGVEDAIECACAQITPSWPLDRFIGVNPFWEMTASTLPSVSARLASLSGARLVMPRAWFRKQFRDGRLTRAHLETAVKESSLPLSVDELIARLDRDEPVAQPRARVVDVADRYRDLRRQMSFRDFVTHASSQLCAAYFDDGQARLPPCRDGGLYPTWRRQAVDDHSPSLVMGVRNYQTLARQLPPTPGETIALGLRDLAIPLAERVSYLHGLLLDLNGWAATCAYRRWIARLAGGEDDSIRHLLAVRVGWEWMLHRAGGEHLARAWRAALAEWPAVDAVAGSAQSEDWLYQRAIEIAWGRPTCERFPSGWTDTPTRSSPAVQVAFCIDVRSEVVRRALEAQSDRVETIGFAGFFGIPIEYLPAGARSARPQLPGLLSPRMRATDTGLGCDVPERRAARLGVAAAWRQVTTSAASSFAFIESTGLLSSAALLADSFSLGEWTRSDRAGLSAAEDRERRPRITSTLAGAPLDTAERAGVAERILRGMSLTQGLAPLVVLMGHGSQTRNNPHAAGLDCGACCGQTGEVNARAAAALLNDLEVRTALGERGLVVPPETWFVAGLHDTTTDSMTLFERDAIPKSHDEALAQLDRWLSAASSTARCERAPHLGVSADGEVATRRAIEARSRDWAEVRPEWGLANNAAFVVARRSRTRHMNFGGRAFLHDYRYEEDHDFSVLELIMTAPMVVTHWINMQYYASTVDNLRYGSGNKTLHNVVGGHLGVFEGNGGDLRIGLPMQSLHDGERWVHTPLRLSVFIEAPAGAIERILQKHDKVRSLVENEWLYLFQLDVPMKTVRAYRSGAWEAVGSSGA